MKILIFLMVFPALLFCEIHCDRMVVYFFCGHSNMSGYCAAMDTVVDSHVWSFNEVRGFYNCTDKDIYGKNGNSGSMVMPFLKRMALLYPGYNFCGIKYGHPCGQAFHVYTEEKHRDFINSRVDAMKTRGTVIGGVVLMYGYIEGQHKNEVDKLEESFALLCAWFRNIVGNKNLPVIICKYEKYGEDFGPAYNYRRWKNIMMEKINALPDIVSNCALVPMRYIPKEYYCDSHHYAKEGYEIIGVDAATTIQEMAWDFWHHE